MTCSRLFRTALAVLTLGCAALHAQSPAGSPTLYGDVLRQYVGTGDAAAAIAATKDWTAQQFERAIDAYLASESDTVAPAAVLQLEIALKAIGPAPVTATECLQIGERLVQRLNARPAAGIDRVEFAARWYAAAASVFLLANDSDRAAPFISRGLDINPDLPELRLMSAVLLELQASSAAALSPAQRAASDRIRLLRLAQRTYEGLLEDHPSFVRARVRLGRVLWILDDTTRAEAELVHARAEAQEPAQQYLAAMFLARIYEQYRDLISARLLYERALAAMPESQSAAAALGFLDVMAGRPDRAQARARAVISRKPAGDEWWAFKYGGSEWDAIKWLRKAVRP